MLRFPLLVACLALGACQSRVQGPGATGAVAPTVAGRDVAAFDGAAAARDAFTRRTEDESFTATLEDAAWLRYQGPPAEIEKKHRAYFEEGYTTFQVNLLTDRFTQPSKETFVLEDSSGRRITSTPITYKSALGGMSGAYSFNYLFSVSFQHSISAQTEWIRLTRQADNQSLEWSFR